MIYTQKLRVVSLPIVAIALTFGSVAIARAANVVFTIDPTRSSLTINQDPTVTLANPTGDVTKLLNVAVKAQSPGADVDFYTGTISADLTGGVLTFTGGSSIVAGLNPGTTPFSPNVNKGVDNYGIQTISATPTTGGIVFAALRDTSYDITSGTLSNGTVPVGMNLQIPNGAFGDITLFGKASTAGGGLNSTGLTASLTTSGGIETLIIPITRITGTSAHVVSIGQFVATRVVPEPSTMVLGGLGVVALALGAWRKRSR